jgi:hypothetical protein
MKSLLLLSAVALALSLPAQALASCGSAFCTVNTSWDVHGAWLEPGARLDLRFESIKQDQPRAGRKDVAVGEIPRHHDEVLTENRNLVGTFDYTFNQDWGLNAQLPLVHRHHEHIHNHMGEQVPEAWTFTGLGDARVLLRRRLASFEDPDKHTIGTAGINFGLKLPTGQTDVRNSDGEQAERTLQPGTGTADFLVGAYYSKDLPERNWSWFVQALAQLPLYEYNDYRPGHRIMVDAGTRYAWGDRVGLLLQANYLFKARDQGLEAEPEDTGGKFLFLSPGVSYALNRRIQAYGFVQLPVYQDVNGVQLVARHALAVGFNVRF